MMTKEQQHIALAEWMGFEYLDSPKSTYHKQWYMKKVGWITTDELPNYPEDLNAIHEVEEKMYELGILAEHYAVMLMKLVPNRELNKSHRRSTAARHFELVNTTASQRCEAACRTLFPERWRE